MMADFHYSLSTTQIAELENRETSWSLDSNTRRMTPIAIGSVTMDTGGGVQVITDTNLAATDIAIVTLESDDTGTAITTPLIAKVTANTLTITRLDDENSADDAVVNYTVFRP
jgi:hypothetical protein